MYREFVPKRFSVEHEDLIGKAEVICAEYGAQGFKLTLRQLYYQFVARAFIPNTVQSYKRLGGVINDARLAGRLDWEAIEDRTRNLEQLPTWDSPKNILEACAQQFRFDRWDSQDTRVEVWVEKEALVGVIEPVCNRWRVPFFACRGYTSQSEAYGAGVRFADYNDRSQGVVILHLGDHDPSGIDMTRDINDRIQMFADYGKVEVRRLALNMDQVRTYNPPPNPAKMTDSRFEDYALKFGNSSWELDALEPRVIAALIERNIEDLIDDERWEEAVAREEKARERIADMARGWED